MQNKQLVLKYIQIVFICFMNFVILAEEAKQDGQVPKVVEKPDPEISGIQINYDKEIIAQPPLHTLSEALAEYFWHKIVPSIKDDKLEPLNEVEVKIKKLEKELPDIKEKTNRLILLKSLLSHMEQLFYWKIVKTTNPNGFSFDDKITKQLLKKWLRYYELTYVLDTKNAAVNLRNMVIISTITKQFDKSIKYRENMLINYINSPYINDIELLMATIKLDIEKSDIQPLPYSRMSGQVKKQITPWHKDWLAMLKELSAKSFTLADIQKWHSIFPPTKIAIIDNQAKKMLENALGKFAWFKLKQKEDDKLADQIFVQELKLPDWYNYYLEYWGKNFYKQSLWELSSKKFLILSERLLAESEWSHLAASMYLKYISANIPLGHKPTFSAYQRMMKVINEKSNWATTPKRKKALETIKIIFYKYYLSLKKQDTFADYVNGMFSFLPLFPSMDKEIAATVYHDMGVYFQGLQQFQKASICFESSANATSNAALQLNRYVMSVENAQWQLKWLPNNPAFLEKETSITLNPLQTRLVSLYEKIMKHPQPHPKKTVINYNYGILLLVSGQYQPAASKINSLIVRGFQKDYSSRAAWLILQGLQQKKNWQNIIDISNFYLQKNYLPFKYDREMLVRVNHQAIIEQITTSSDSPQIKIRKLNDFLQKNPNTPAMIELTYSLAITYQQIENFTETLSYYEKHLKLLPIGDKRRQKILQTLALLNDNLLQLEKSAEFYEDLFKEYPKDEISKKGLMLAIQVREGLLDYEKALFDTENLIHALGKDPTAFDYSIKKATLLGLMGKVSEGEVFIKQLFDKVSDPLKKSELYVLAVEYCRKNSLNKESLGYINQFVQMSKDEKDKKILQLSAKIHYYWGELYVNKLDNYLASAVPTKAVLAEAIKGLNSIKNSLIKSLTQSEDQRWVVLSNLRLADVYYSLYDLSLKVAISGQVLNQKQTLFFKEQATSHIQKAAQTATKTKLTLDEYWQLNRLQASILNLKSIDYYLFPPDRFLLTKTLLRKGG